MDTLAITQSTGRGLDVALARPLQVLRSDGLVYAVVPELAADA